MVKVWNIVRNIVVVFIVGIICGLVIVGVLLSLMSVVSCGG